MIIIPAAGKGLRFVNEGVTTPKPFIDVQGKPMIQVATENLGMLDEPHIFIMRRDHSERYKDFMKVFLRPNWKMVLIDEITEGPACTCLKAKEFITDEPLLYANCDQYLDWSPKQFLYDMQGFDGGMLMVRDRSECGSFAVMDESCYVKRTVEKEVISDVSSTGIYYWTKGTDFVKYAEQMIERNHRAKNGEFYAINVFNEGIAEGKKYVVSFIKRFWRLGVPSELDQYLKDHA